MKNFIFGEKIRYVLLSIIIKKILM